MYLLGVLVTLAFLAFLALVALLVRDVRAEQRATRECVLLMGRALAEQLARQHEEQRRHLDAAAAAIVVQVGAQLAAVRPRASPRVEVRPAPPLRSRSDEPTPPAGTPRPREVA